MIARIYNEDGTSYYSVIFAQHFGNGKYLVFNKEMTELEWIKQYSRSNSVYKKQPVGYSSKIRKNFDIVGRVKDEVVRTKINTFFLGYVFFEGLDWFVSSDEFALFVRKKKAFSEKILEKCKELNKTIEIKEWNEINDDFSAETLLTVAYSFHDAYITKVEINGNMTEITFGRGFSNDIHLKLEDARLSEKLVPTKDWGDDFIFSCTIFNENGRWVWVDDIYIDSFSDIEKQVSRGESVRYFTAERILWKLEGSI